MERIFGDFLPVVQVLAILAAAFCLMGILGGLVWWIKSSPDEAAQSTVSQQPEQSYEQAIKSAENMSLREIVDNVIQAHGGRSAIKDINSISIHGSMDQNGESYPHRYVWKSPHYLLLTWQHSGKKGKVAFNGKTVWREISEKGTVINREILENKQAFLLRHSADIAYPTFPDLSDLNHVTRAPNQDFQNNKVIVLKREFDQQPDYVYFISPKTFHVVGLKKLFHDLPNSPIEEMLAVLEDYQEFQGIRFPTSQSLYLDGKINNRVKLEGVELNQGIFQSFFDPPEELNP